jgi:hypothetical protein
MVRKTCNEPIYETRDKRGNELYYKIKEFPNGFGSRSSGVKIRTGIIDSYKQSGKSVVMDFEGINVISSGFADELIGKLVAIYGFYGFNNIFKLRNMNETVQTIVQRSVAQRMNESFNNDK